MTRPKRLSIPLTGLGSDLGVVWPLYPNGVVEVDGIPLSRPIGQSVLQVIAESTQRAPAQLHWFLRQQTQAEGGGG